MKIGCPKEIKNHEYRVGLTPASVRAYVDRGHEVFVERGAGLGSGLPDEDYTAAGARLLDTAAEVWERGDLIIKVKEPLPPEYEYLTPGKMLYTFFHFAADEELTRVCLEKKISAVAYETVQEADGSLPLLKPMSEVAGRMAPLMGCYFLSKFNGGRGLLPTGVPGVSPAGVLIVGGGTVGSNAARVAAGLGARVTVLDVDIDLLERLADTMPPNVVPLFSDSYTLEMGLREAVIVVGAVLIRGAKAPRLIRRHHLQLMKPGSVFLDVAIDQGGCSETSRPTTHADPVYVVDDIIHYCVANMPGAYARTSTFALNNRTIKYGLILADEGLEKACASNAAIRNGLNLHGGFVTFKPVAEAFGWEDRYRSSDNVLFQ